MDTPSEIAKYIIEDTILITILICFFVCIFIFGFIKFKKRSVIKKIDKVTISQKSKTKKLLKNKKIIFIINPSKPASGELKMLINQYCKDNSLDDYNIIETTRNERGAKQATDAVYSGADIIVACGGDGTVRQVACGISTAYEGLGSEMISKDVEMGIIPIGTANLLARNLNIVLDDIRIALRTAIYGGVTNFDLGYAICDKTPSKPHAFAVIAGVGFDSKMVKKTNDNLKEKIGFLAYFSAGLKEIFAKKIKVKVTIYNDNSEKTYNLNLKSIMVGNCGKIPGFDLIPDAKFNDKLLDIVAINTSAGILGWGQLSLEMIMQNLGVSKGSKYKMGRIEHKTAQKVVFEFDEPKEMQLDGDLVNFSKKVTFTLSQKQLILKVPFKNEL